MLLLPFFPLATVIVGMFSITYVRCDEFECADVMQDVLECDAMRCYDDCGFGCFCCTVCHDRDPPTYEHNDNDVLYDDSSKEVRSQYYYSKKS